MTHLIQEGVHFGPGETPPGHFAVALLNIEDSSTTDEVLDALHLTWETIAGLKAGQIVDLPGVHIDPEGLSVVIGYGARLFDALGLSGKRPPELTIFRKPRFGGGGQISLGSSLHYESHVTTNVADCAVAIQFTARSALSVRRAVVEVWKALEHRRNESGHVALRIVGNYNGFGRKDRRSWIDFFDGTANMRSDERLGAIQIKERGHVSPDQWKEGGTYLCFMRIRLAIQDWQKLTRAQQELLVGRDRVSGCALFAEGDDDEIRPVPSCPVIAGGTIEDGNNERFRDAPRPPRRQELRQSHIHRTNQGRSTPGDPESRLIYRQGYEFMEGVDAGGVPDLGLNFVSFQDTPERIVGMLKLPEWLGGVNFGGDPRNQLPGMAHLLRIHAAGFFVTPPRRVDGGLPGESIFEALTV